MRVVETVVLLVAVAAVVAAFARRLRVPAPCLLVVAGLVAGLLPGAPAVHVPPAVVSLVVLPPLLYVASEQLAWRDLRAVWRPVVTLAVGLVLATAAAVAAVAGAVASVTASMAFVLGAVLASTDPVAVSALARRLSLPSRLRALVQAESLFNDGTSLVLFQIAVMVAAGGGAGMTVTGTLLHGAAEFVILAGGGIAAGAVVAAGAIVMRRRITDPVLETVAALLTPYVAYLLGENLHVSGVTAVIVAGLVIGARQPKITTAQARLQVHAVFQTVVFVLESVVFALIGLELPAVAGDLGQTGPWLGAALAVAGTLIAARIAWVFPAWAVLQRRRGARRPSWPVPAVVSWAGTRGVVPLAAALSIPLTTAQGSGLPQRDLVLVLAAAAIVFSLVVQGFTLEPLARFAGFGASAAGPGHEETLARLRMAEAAMARLDELAEAGAVPDTVIDRLRDGLQAGAGPARPAMDQSPGSQPAVPPAGDLRGELIGAQSAELARLLDAGMITAATRRRLQLSLDLEAAQLTDRQQ